MLRQPRPTTLKGLARRLLYFLEGAAEDCEAGVYLQLGLARLFGQEDQYCIDENRLTHALAQVFAREGEVAREFLRMLGWMARHTSSAPKGSAPGDWMMNYQRHHGHAWWKVLVTSVILFLVGLVILVLTENPNVFPTVVMLGNFMVPVTYVVFFYERSHLSDLTLPITATSFVYGGLLGVFAAALLEPILLHGLNLLTVFEIGLIEEFAKILGVLVIARRRRHHEEMDGLILGAAAGMGFAALESTGYAFTAFLSSGGSLSTTVAVTLLRGLVSPMGHGTWTAILAGVLFRESPDGRVRINRKVIEAYLVVATLHGLWDAFPILLDAFAVSGTGILIGQTGVAAVGFLLLWKGWREARARQDYVQTTVSNHISL